MQRRADPLGADTGPFRIRNGGVELAVETLGDPADAPILFLHGFPEHRGAWRKVARHLAGEFHCMLSDLRGYGESGRPEETEAYRIDALICDVDALVDACGGRKPILAGHDWGGALAWRYAAAFGEKLASLVIANAPHPALFQRRLIDNPAQRAASAYIDRLRHPEAAARLLTDGPEGLWDRMFAANPVFDDADRAEYLAAWSRPGAMEAMLNWYRAAPFELPASDDAAVPDWAARGDLMVTIPTLILWGMADRVFLPVLLEGLDPLVPDRRIVRFPDAGHAIIHEEAAALAAHIREFATP
ncbi:alpha/beta hydrolase [Parasphingopyxis algicola]|uniref:alpha/beta fold hydrolase n=1 Tax=Parasphingopyxis algicola TaxID=2026624 RepID=UPI0015A08F94|nr:alpha/beta hydrolase [Parasphingopyxis algicola]QLC25367.1 alpha/beta hydrolase [Parasphingopyxis algicola]